MIILYTVIFGASDTLKRAPAGPDGCVCFTDDAKLLEDPRGWTIVLRKAEHARRAARMLKTTPDDLFPKASATVWCDGSIELRDWARLIADADGAQVAACGHPHRDNCYDEGRTVVRLERADPSKVAEALELYRSEGFVPTKLSTTGLLYRARTERVAAFNRYWREHLDRYGINDQVHVDYCAWKAGVEIRKLAGDYLNNPYAQYDRADHNKRRRPQYDAHERCEHYLAG